MYMAGSVSVRQKNAYKQRKLLKQKKNNAKKKFKNFKCCVFHWDGMVTYTTYFQEFFQ